MNNEKDEMKTISFDDNGQPVAKETAEGKANESNPANAGTPKEQHHKASLKEKVSELELEIEVLKNELDNAEKDKLEYLNLAQRAKAEFDNYRKRTADQIINIRKDGIADGVLKVLPVYDIITKASTMISDEKTLKGLEMIMQQLKDSFKALGVEQIEALGADFNPDFHNAVMREEAETEEGKDKVTEVFQEGFIMDGKVLRYSMVKVSI